MKKILLAIVVLFFLSGCGAMLRAEGERWKKDPLGQALDTAAEIMLLDAFDQF